MRKIREVLRLKVEARLSDEQVAKAICSARSTVQECLRRAREAGLSWPLPPELDEEALHARLYQRARHLPRDVSKSQCLARPRTGLGRSRRMDRVPIARQERQTPDPA